MVEFHSKFRAGTDLCHLMRHTCDSPFSDSSFQDAFALRMARQHFRRTRHFDGHASGTFRAYFATRHSTGAFLLCSPILLASSITLNAAFIRQRRSLGNRGPFRSIHPASRRFFYTRPSLFPQEPHRQMVFTFMPPFVLRPIYIQQLP